MIAAGEFAAATAAHDHRVSVTVTCTPAGNGRLTRRWVDVIRLQRDGNHGDGRVTGSIRIPGTTLPSVVRGPQRAASAQVDALFARGPRSALPARGGLLWSGATITAGQPPRILVTLQSAVGAALAGGCGPAAAEAVLHRVGEWRSLLAPSSRPLLRPPAGWRGLPVMLRPPVAAAVLVGVRDVLTSPAATRFDGRRVLPPVTLTDRPVEHGTGEPDDAGHPAEPWTLVREGTVRTMPRDRSTGLPQGRAVWQHDEGRLTAATALDLELAGAVRRAPLEDHPDLVELVQCVQRGSVPHTGGWMRLICLARIGRAPHPFLVALAGRPLSLLRAVHALSGDAAATCTDHLVRTPSLALPTALALDRSPDVRLDAL
jgi:hypothetical protein